MKILAKLFRKSPAPEPTIKVVLVSSSVLTLDQWRKDTRLVAAARELARNETFRMMVAVLENSHVRFVALPTIGVSQDDRAAHQARGEGYQICLNNLEAMGEPWQVGKMPRETFQSPLIPKPK